MEQELNFSLSYEQLTEAAKEAIVKCDLTRGEEAYIQELSRATAILGFWHSLALRGHGVYGIERVDTDWERLKALIYKEGDGVA